VLAPDAPRFTILAATDAYREATNTQRSAILGKGIFEVFPDYPDDPATASVAMARASIQYVLEHGEANFIGDHKHDIHRPQSEGGGFEERHWDAVNTPVMDGDGRLAYIIHRVEDVTELVQLRQKQAKRQADNTELQDSRRTAILQQEMMREQAEFLDLAHNTFIERDLDGTIRSWNHGAEEMYGYTRQEAIGRISHYLLRAVFPQPLAEIEKQILQEGRWEGELTQATKDGTLIVAFSRWVMRRDKNGRASGVMEINNDITTRKRAEEELFAANQRLRALLQALPVGVSFSDDHTCQNITGNPAFLAQFEFKPEDDISASSMVQKAPGRAVRFLQNGRLLGDADLPLQRAVAENRQIAVMELEVQLPSGRRWVAECYGAPIHDAKGNVEAGRSMLPDANGPQKR
jgi:PAS domain S-box-containing protein